MTDKIVEFNETWRTELRFFVDMADWRDFVPRFKELKAAIPGVVHAALGHTTDPRDGIRFGSGDLSVEYSARVWLEERGLLEPSNPERPSQQETRQHVETRGRPRVCRGKYPFEELVKVGDHFLVSALPGKAHHVRNAVSHRRDGRTYMTKFLENIGVLVVLVSGPGLNYDREVEL